MIDIFEYLIGSINLILLACLQQCLICCGEPLGCFLLWRQDSWHSKPPRLQQPYRLHYIFYNLYIFIHCHTLSNQYIPIRNIQIRNYLNSISGNEILLYPLNWLRHIPSKPFLYFNILKIYFFEYFGGLESPQFYWCVWSMFHWSFWHSLVNPPYGIT